MKEISKTGYWFSETADSHHVHCPELAKWITTYLKSHPKEKRIWDFGCGKGEYLLELNNAGFKNCVGIEADPPKSAKYERIYRIDLTTPIINVEKGVVICLEVLEHIPKSLSPRVINNIKNCCDSILILSWAVVGQPGFGHINCMNNPEVIKLFENNGFRLLEEDTIQARNIINDSPAPWFKNTLLIFKKI